MAGLVAEGAAVGPDQAEMREEHRLRAPSSRSPSSTLAGARRVTPRARRRRRAPPRLQRTSRLTLWSRRGVRWGYLLAVPRRAATPEAEDPQARRGRPRRSGRRRRRLVLALLVLALLAWAGWAGLQVLAAARDDQAGEAALGDAAAAVANGGLSASAGQADLHTAAGEFAAARRHLDGAAVVPFRYVPLLGRQLDSADALTTAGVTLGTAGDRLLSEVNATVALPRATSPERLALADALAREAGSAAALLNGLPLGPSGLLLSPLAAARARLAEDVGRLGTSLAKASAGLDGLVSLVGHPQRVLLLGASNAEMRDGSGSFLVAAPATTGGPTLLSVGAPVQAGLVTARAPGVAVPPSIGRLWGWMGPGEALDALGASPDFAAQAPIAARLWVASGHASVRSVVAVDVAGLADLLQATGPVVVAGRELSAANAVTFLDQTQYDGVSAYGAGAQGIAERAFGAVVGEVLTALVSRPIAPLTLAHAVAAAVNGRHVLVWSAAPASEADWARAGVAGRLAPQDLLVGLMNLGANKLDPLTSVSVRGTIRPEPGHDVSRLTLAVTVHDGGSAVSDLVDGPAPGLHARPGEYLGALVFNLPAFVQTASVEHVSSLVAEGRTSSSGVLAPFVDLLPGQTRTWTVEATVPRHGELVVLSSARVPPEQWRVDGVSFTDQSPEVVRW